MRDQLVASLEGIAKRKAPQQEVIVAYEPIWAIDRARLPHSESTSRKHPAAHRDAIPGHREGHHNLGQITPAVLAVAPVPEPLQLDLAGLVDILRTTAGLLKRRPQKPAATGD